MEYDDAMMGRITGGMWQYIKSASTRRELVQRAADADIERFATELTASSPADTPVTVKFGDDDYTTIYVNSDTAQRMFAAFDPAPLDFIDTITPLTDDC